MTDSESGKSAAAAALKPLFEAIRGHMDEVNEELARVYRSPYPAVDSLLSYLTGYQGKRMRPAMVFLSGLSCGSLNSEHRMLAMVLEMLHTATLIHDDIIDKADVRRKVVSVNRKFGNETAVLLGDFLFAESFKLAVRFEDLETRAEVSQLCKDICLGEILEISHRFDIDLTEEQYIDIVHKKTAILFEVGCGLSARLAGGNDAQVEALRNFAKYLGMAFQIVDDCLDLVGQEDAMGKSLGNDVTHGMTTLPIIYFYRTASSGTRDAFREKFLSPQGVERGRAIQDFLKESDAVDQAYRVAKEWTTAARQSLLQLPETRYRDALNEVLEFVVQRIC